MAGLGAIGNVGQLVATLGLNTQPFMQGMNATQKKLATINNGFMAVGRTMTRFVTLPMALAGGAAVKTQKDFEASMTKIIGLVGVSRDVVEGWSKEVLKMSAVTGRGPEELADALYFVTSAGIRGAEAMEVLEMSAKASAVGLGETKTVADLVTSAMNAYGKENLSAAQAVDILVASVREGKAEADELAGAMGMVLPIASEFGVTFDQVGAAFAGMTRTGTNARVAATQLKNILATMASPSEQTQKALAKIDMTAADFRRTIREEGLIQALLDLRRATEGNEEAMSEIFPNIRGLMGVLDLLGKNVDYNVQIFDALTNAAGSLDAAFEEVGGTTQQRLNVAMATLKSTMVSIGEALKPLVTQVLTWLSDKLTEVSEKWSNFTESQRKAQVAIIGLTAAIGPLAIAISRAVALFSSSAGVYLAIAAAVVAVAIGVKKLVERFTELGRISKRTRKEQDAIRQSADEEAASVYEVFKRLQQAEKGTKEWNRAKNIINSRYGKYLDNLISEKDSLEDLEKAMKKVTMARQADILIKGYGSEIERLGSEYASEFSGAIDKWSKIVRAGRVQLKDQTGRASFEFAQEIEKALSDGIAMVDEGATVEEARAKVWKVAGDIYDEFIAGLDNAPRGSRKRSQFQRNIEKLLQVKNINLGEREMIQGLIDEITSTIGEGSESIQLIDIEQQIADLEKMKGKLEETDRLYQLIGLHKQKMSLVNEDLRAGEEAIIKTYEAQLNQLKGSEKSLHFIESAQGRITELEKERTSVGDARREQINEEIAGLKIAIKEKENELSAHGDILKLQEHIRIEKEKADMLDEEAQKKAYARIRFEEIRLENMQASVKGLGEIAKKELLINQYKQAQAYTTGSIYNLMQSIIDGLEKEVQVAKLLAAGYNEQAILAHQIKVAEDELVKVQGKELKNAQKLILVDKIRLLDQELRNSLLSEEERRQKEILKLEYERLLLEGGAGTAEIEERLRALNQEDNLLQKIIGRRTGEVEPISDSKEHWDKLKKQLGMLKELRKEGEITAREFRTNANEVMSEMVGIANGYVQKVGGILSNFAQGVADIFEAQKQRELSAAGDNAKKREAIERKYFKKQQRVAIMQGIINTALAVGNALTTKPFIPMGLIAAGIAAAAGAAQVALISAQSFAKGGIAFDEVLAKVGDYPQSRSNPEVIAPLSDLKKYIQPEGASGPPKEIMLKMRGRDVYALVKTQDLLNNTY